MTDILINFKKSGDEIVIGALREIGAAAVNFLGEAAGMALDFAKDSFAGAIEAQAGIDKLNASILRMGDSSPVTAQEAQDLAEQFKNLAGGSDDAILAAENVLLRFDKIGSEVFPDVIQASADLAAAMGMDLNAAATLVGKTLQDMSTDGTASLGRLKAAGIQFTEAQEKEIEALVKAGKVTEAQNILLDALAETTGGAAAAQAETLAGKWAIFQETIADAGEGIAMKLLPPLSKLFDDVIAPAIPLITSFAEILATSLGNLLNGNVRAGLEGLGEGLYEVLPPEVAGPLNDALTKLSGYLQNDLPLALSNAQTALQPVIDGVLNVWAAFRDSMPQIQAAVQVMADFVMAKINELMPTLITNVSSALNSLAEFWRAHGAEIMAVITVAFEVITVTVSGAMTLISGGIAAILEIINGDWDGATKIWLDTIVAFWDLLLSLVDTNLAEFLSTWMGNFDLLILICQTAMANVGNAILSGLQSAIDGAWAIINGVSAIGTAIIDGIKAGVTSAAQSLIDSVSGAVGDAVQKAKNLLGIHSPSAVFAGIGQNMMLGMAQGISGNANAPAMAVAGASNAVINVGGISISGAGNPQAVAAAVKAELDRMGRSADTRMRTR